MSEEAIRIECPGCHRKFRMRSRGSSGRTAVKCPKCGAKIPLPSDAPPPPPSPSKQAPPTPPRPTTTDAELRRMLLKARNKRTTDLTDTQGEADRTVPDLPTVSDDTDPEYGAQTMPMGRNALTARDLGTDRAGAATLRRKRLETPRAGAMVAAPSLRPPEPPAEIERPVVDEPTYTGPMPGRAPHITPSGSDLSRFLEPGNYLVRVEDVVYDPVTEKELVRLLNAGVFFAIDEMRAEGGEWIPISSPELFNDLRARLAHRAHHMLARVVPGKPASEFGRPAPHEPEPELPRPEPETRPSVIVADLAEAEPAPLPVAAPPTRKRVPAFAIPALLALLAVGATGASLLLVPSLRTWAGALVASDAAVDDDIDATSLAILAPEDAGDIDPVPTFQSAIAAVHSAHDVADSIDGMLEVANEIGDQQAATSLAFEKWKRKPSTVEPGPLIQQLMARKEWFAARQVANWAVVTKGESKELRDVINTSLRKQFEAETVIPITTKRFTRIVRVDPGHRPAFVLMDQSGDQWTMWPDLGPDDWRNDIAVYRLCQLMVCHFRIPETRQIEIDQDTYKALVDASDDAAKEMATKLKADFDWDKNGKLNGSLRAVPHGVPWPIELSQIWRPWLTAGAGLAQLDDDVEQAHQKIAFFGAERVYPELQGMRARQLARQVSSILLVDYLVNNWNRFAPTEENWGSRTRIDDGLVYSVEDSAAFLGDDSVRVNGRFSWSKRFSRATIDSLKKLDKDVVAEFLFPNPTKGDKEKLENLWTQRSRALRRIEKLVKRYGAEDVYALDGRPKEGK